MRRLGPIFALVVVTVVLGQPWMARGGPIPSFRGLGDLPGGVFGSAATGISGDGRVVIGGGTGPNGHVATRWTEEEGMVPLNLGPGIQWFEAFGVSHDGSVIVGTTAAGSGQLGPEAARWTSATGVVRIGDLPGGAFSSFARGVSGDGTAVVGWGSQVGALVPFRWTQSGGMVPQQLFPEGGGRAFAISADGSTIIGHASTDKGLEAIRWDVNGQAEIIGDLPGGTVNATANAVSADGSVVVGMSYGTNDRREAFRWTAETGMVGLGDVGLGSFNSEAFGVSADGSVVVGSSSSGGAAFIWTEVTGMQSLEDLLVNKYGLADELEGWNLGPATGISADGTVIVGYGVSPNISGLDFSEAWVAEIPEPGSLVLCLLGVACLIVWRITGRRYHKGRK